MAELAENPAAWSLGMAFSAVSPVPAAGTPMLPSRWPVEVIGPVGVDFMMALGFCEEPVPLPPGVAERAVWSAVVSAEG